MLAPEPVSMKNQCFWFWIWAWSQNIPFSRDWLGVLGNGRSWIPKNAENRRGFLGVGGLKRLSESKKESTDGENSWRVLIKTLGGEVWAQTEVVSVAGALTEMGAGLTGVIGRGVDGGAVTPPTSLNYYLNFRESFQS